VEKERYIPILDLRRAPSCRYPKPEPQA
jgi:hypothetical protein